MKKAATIKDEEEREPVTAFIALGTNLGPGRKIFSCAMKLLEREPRLRIVSSSEWMETRPAGPVQPGYLNAVLRIETLMLPEVLLAWLHCVERICGRVRSGARWAPRILDIDLVNYGNRIIIRPKLWLPHPGWKRSFVRIPLEQVGGIPDFSAQKNESN